MPSILISYSLRWNKHALNMDLVTVFLLTFMHANLILSKNVIRQYMDPTNEINSKENDLTKINPAAQMNYGTDNSKPQSSIKQKMFPTEMNPNLISTTETIVYVQKLDSAEQLYINQMRDIAAKKQAAKQKLYQATSITQNFFATEIIPYLPGSTQKIYLQKLDPSEQMHKIELRDRAAKKQATRQKYIADNIDATPFRTTSEDTIRWLLKKKLPFPDPAPGQIGQAENGIMFPITEPIWRFEDYDNSKSYNDRVRDEHSDCEGQRIQCIHDTEYNQPVCVTDLSIPDAIPVEGRIKGFASQCEVEWRNCLKRYELTGKYYADSYTEDYLDFLHYGWCTHCLGDDPNCNYG